MKADEVSRVMVGGRYWGGADAGANGTEGEPWNGPIQLYPAALRQRWQVNLMEEGESIQQRVLNSGPQGKKTEKNKIKAK